MLPILLGRRLFRFVQVLTTFHGLAHADPRVTDSRHVTYQGLERAGVEVFLNIPYAQDTGGENRFKPPKPHVPCPGSIINATAYGPACPQPLGNSILPLALSNVTEISEDCLNLNIARPLGSKPGDNLPVLVYIYGGSLWLGMNAEITVRPDGMILESQQNNLPVIHVAMNYRLGSAYFHQAVEGPSNRRSLEPVWPLYRD